MIDNFDQKEEIDRLKRSIEPHNLSKIVCECIKNQTDINSAIKAIIKESVENDVGIQNLIINILHTHFRIWIQVIGWIATLILAFISGGYFR